MECINGSEVFYYDNKLDEYFFKSPYNVKDYSLLIQIYDISSKKYYVDVLDLSDLDRLDYFDFEYIIYLLNKTNMNIFHIIN